MEADTLALVVSVDGKFKQNTADYRSRNGL